jgi:hypothetical protein
MRRFTTMSGRGAGFAFAVLVSLGLLRAQASAPDTFTRADAESLSRKLERISENATLRARDARTTQILEREVNAYLRYAPSDTLPPGLLEPTVGIVGGGRLSGRALVDIDAIKARRPPQQQGWFDPVALLSGKVPVMATGTLQAASGVGRFSLESAEVSGVPVPTTVIQELVSLYSRTPERPQGFSLDQPFELPAGIREIRVGTQQALIVQ